MLTRGGRFRFRELELLIIPSLLIFCGFTLLLAIEQGTVRFRWDSSLTSVAFVIGLLAVHIILTLIRFRGDQVLFPTAAILSAIGLVLMYRLQEAGTNFPDLRGVATKQTIWFFLGLALMLIALLRYDWVYKLRHYKYTLVVLGIVMMLGLFIPGLHVTTPSGVSLWYNLRLFQFQPSEIVKVLLVIFFASYLDERRDLLASEYRLGPLKLPPLPYLAPMLLMWGFSILLLVVLRDLGDALLFFGIFLAMLYAVTGRALYIWVLGAFFAAGAFLSYQLFATVQQRFDAWLYPFQNLDNSSYQIVQSMFALASGGTYGSGLGYGIPFIVPEINTDSIFIAIGEELGLVGALAVIGLYVVMIFRGFHIAFRATRGFDQLMAIGLSSILGIQTIVIIGGDIKLIPLTGITLPFIAYGGSSTVANFIMIGLLLGLSGARSRETIS